MTELSHDRIKAQLEKILASSEFLDRKQASQFLRYVVEQALNGRSGRIKQYTVAVEALGYGSNFDPQTNPTVRIEARRLRRSLEIYYYGQGVEDQIRIDIPKGGYIPVFLDKHVPSNARDSSKFSAPVSEQTTPKFVDTTIAIFHFENLNEKDENIFLARGLTAEIITSLTRFSGLAVLGPLAQTEGQTIDFYKISHEYGARFVLQGGIRSQGSRIRITANLTDASTGNKQWGQTFEYDLEKTSLFEIEDGVASQVAGVVADGLGVIFRKLHSETYHQHLKLNEVTMAVLKYNNAWTTHAPQDWETAHIAVTKALTGQQESALLVALQSNIYYADVLHELNMVPDSRERMERLALKAVSLDPDLQVAQYNLAVQNAFHGRTKECVEVAQKVVAMNPNHARILAGCAVATTSVGAYDIGWDFIERAKRLNPHYPGWYHFINYLVYFGEEKYEKAWIEVQKVYVEGLFIHPLFRASILGKLGKTREAKPYIDELLQTKPEFPKRPREYIRLLFVIDKHVEMIWDGLYKAGMREIV